MGESKIDPQTYNASERIRAAELDGVMPCHADVELVNGAWLETQLRPGTSDGNVNAVTWGAEHHQHRLALAVAIARQEGFDAGRKRRDDELRASHWSARAWDSTVAGSPLMPGQIVRIQTKPSTGVSGVAYGTLPKPLPGGIYPIRQELGVQDMKNGVSALPHGKYGAITTVSFTDAYDLTMKAANGILRSGGDEANQYREEVKRLAGGQQANADNAVPNGSSQADWPGDDAEAYDPFDPKNWGV